MKTIDNNFIRFLVCMLGVLVISLGGSVFAAGIPAVATLEPIANGLLTPLKTALDSDGSIYVADPRSGGVVQLDQYGNLKQVIKTAVPANVVALIDSTKSNISNGKILVGLGNYVAVLDQNGKEVARLGSGTGQFVKTAGIAVDTDGNIYVTDSGAYNVKKFNSSGAYLTSFGSMGTSAGKFLLPTAIAAVNTSAGMQIAVVDTLNGKVVFFTKAGVYQRKIGTSGTGPLLFNYPVGVSFEYSNGTMSRMYVLDAFQGLIQAIDPVPALGAFLSYVGSYGDKRGNLLTPSDVIFDQTNKRLLVANGLSNIVSFGIDGGKNPVYSVPPRLTVDQPVTTVNSASMTLTGTVDPGCTLVASADTAAQVGAVTLPTASSWTASIDSLKPGINVVSITAKNNYGTSTTKTATIQYVPPTAALSINLFPSLTSQPSVVLSGTAEPGSYVYVGNAANGVSGLADITGSGAWNYTMTLVEGYNDIAFTVTRPGAGAGFRSIAITLDTRAPALTVSALPDGSSTANQVQNISGIALDPNLAGVTVNGTSVPVINGSFSYALSLVKGPNTVTVVAGDSLRNQSTNSRTITFTPALPKITVLSLADGSYTNVRDITVSGSVDKAAAVTVNGIAANPGGGLDWSASVRLSSGINTIEIAAIDEFESVAKDKRTIIYDAVAPVITIDTPSRDIAVKSPGLTISGTIVKLNNEVAIKSVKATVNGTDKQVTLADGKFSLFADFAAEGTYTVAVTATDMANNVSTAQRSIVYDTTPPAFSVDKVLVPYPPALTGTVEAGATVVIKDAAGSLCEVVNAGNKWTADLSGRPYDPATLVVRATDAAGNDSAALAINPPVPDGDMDGDGKVTVMDAVVVIRLVVSQQPPTDQQLAHGDIGPLLNGKINPKGRLDVVDAILILRKALGLPSWQ